MVRDVWTKHRVQASSHANILLVVPCHLGLGTLERLTFTFQNRLPQTKASMLKLGPDLQIRPNELELARLKAQLLDRLVQVDARDRRRGRDTFDNELPVDLVQVELVPVECDDCICLGQQVPQNRQHLHSAVTPHRIKHHALLAVPLGGETQHAPWLYQPLQRHVRVKQTPNVSLARRGLDVEYKDARFND